MDGCQCSCHSLSQSVSQTDRRDGCVFSARSVQYLLIHLPSKLICGRVQFHEVSCNSRQQTDTKTDCRHLIRKQDGNGKLPSVKHDLVSMTLRACSLILPYTHTTTNNCSAVSLVSLVLTRVGSMCTKSCAQQACAFSRSMS